VGDDQTYSIEELAARAGMTPRNVRAYRTRGLLPPPLREGRITRYNRSHLERLREVQRLREAGVSLRAITAAAARGDDISQVGSLWLRMVEEESPWSEGGTAGSRLEHQHRGGTTFGGGGSSVDLRSDAAARSVLATRSTEVEAVGGRVGWETLHPEFVSRLVKDRALREQLVALGVLSGDGQLLYVSSDVAVSLQALVAQGVAPVTALTVVAQAGEAGRSLAGLLRDVLADRAHSMTPTLRDLLMRLALAIARDGLAQELDLRDAAPIVSSASPSDRVEDSSHADVLPVDIDENESEDLLAVAHDGDAPYDPDDDRPDDDFSAAGAGEPPRSPPRFERSDPAARSPVRYLTGEMPARVKVDAEFSLVVAVHAGAPGYGVAAPMILPDTGPAGTPVTIVIQPEAALVALGDLQGRILVPPFGAPDPPPLRFALRAAAVGLSRVRVTAWRGGTFLAAVGLEVSVETAQIGGQVRRVTSPVSGVQGEPGEVTLQVHFDGTQYSFQLLSHRNLYGPVRAESLTAQPGQALERTVSMLRKMAGATSGYTPSLAARWVRETGVGLWRDMVPQLIQEQFWELRDDIRSFTIASDRDAMPWELLYPIRPKHDDGFLIEQFPVLRRVFDQGRASRVLVGDARFVVPPKSPRNAADEIATLRRFLGLAEDAVISTLAELLDLVDSGSAGTLHFACHNTFSLESGGSSITMADGPFVPQLLNSAVAVRGLASRHPLVFLNACRTAGVAPEYTQMMGWAGQFMAAGAGAFVGTLWPVSSLQASRFAEAFYAALTAGGELGQAALTARRETKDDSDPTWLAYTVYGDPTALSVPLNPRRPSPT
jgi:DNA-binding transcriptional MerR regulator